MKVDRFKFDGLKPQSNLNYYNLRIVADNK